MNESPIEREDIVRQVFEAIPVTDVEGLAPLDDSVVVIEQYGSFYPAFEGVAKPLTMNAYQAAARTTATYPDRAAVVYPILGLVGEAGEVAEKFMRAAFPGGPPLEWDDLSLFVRGLYRSLQTAAVAARECERYKKLLRDKAGELPAGVLDDLKSRVATLTDEQKAGLLKETSDVLWYVSTTSGDLGATLGEVGQANLDKLASRKERGVLGGSGDGR